MDAPQCDSATDIPCDIALQSSPATPPPSARRVISSILPAPNEYRAVLDSLTSIGALHSDDPCRSNPEPSTRDPDPHIPSPAHTRQHHQHQTDTEAEHLNAMMSQLELFESQLWELAARNAALEDELRAARSDAETATTALLQREEQYRSERQELLDTLAELQEALTLLASDAAQCRTQLAQELEATKAELEAARTSAAQRVAEISELTALLAREREDAANLQRQLATRQAEFAAERSQLEDQLRILRAALHAATEDALAVQAAASAERAALQSELDKLRSQVEQLEREVAESRQNELDTLGRAHSIVLEIEKLQREYSLDDAFHGLDSALDAVRAGPVILPVPSDMPVPHTNAPDASPPMPPRVPSPPPVALGPDVSTPRDEPPTLTPVPTPQTPDHVESTGVSLTSLSTISCPSLQADQVLSTPTSSCPSHPSTHQPPDEPETPQGLHNTDPQPPTQDTHTQEQSSTQTTGGGTASTSTPDTPGPAPAPAHPLPQTKETTYTAQQAPSASPDSSRRYRLLVPGASQPVDIQHDIRSPSRRLLAFRGADVIAARVRPATDLIRQTLDTMTLSPSEKSIAPTAFSAAARLCRAIIEGTRIAIPSQAVSVVLAARAFAPHVVDHNAPDSPSPNPPGVIWAAFDPNGNTRGVVLRVGATATAAGLATGHPTPVRIADTCVASTSATAGTPTCPGATTPRCLPSEDSIPGVTHIHSLLAVPILRPQKHDSPVGGGRASRSPSTPSTLGVLLLLNRLKATTAGAHQRHVVAPYTPQDQLVAEEIANTAGSALSRIIGIVWDRFPYPVFTE